MLELSKNKIKFRYHSYYHTYLSRTNDALVHSIDCAGGRYSKNKEWDPNWKKKSFTFEKKKHIAKVNQTIDWLLNTDPFEDTVQNW